MTGGASYPRTEIQNVKNTCGKCVHCSMDCAFIVHYGEHRKKLYRGADKSLARPTSRSILFDGEENISFDTSLVIYINIANIPPIMIINRIYELKIFCRCSLFPSWSG